jgi:hypothetical protein
VDEQSGQRPAYPPHAITHPHPAPKPMATLVDLESMYFADIDL